MLCYNCSEGRETCSKLTTIAYTCMFLLVLLYKHLLLSLINNDIRIIITAMLLFYCHLHGF